MTRSTATWPCRPAQAPVRAAAEAAQGQAAVKEPAPVPAPAQGRAVQEEVGEGVEALATGRAMGTATASDSRRQRALHHRRRWCLSRRHRRPASQPPDSAARGLQGEGEMRWSLEAKNETVRTPLCWCSPEGYL